MVAKKIGVQSEIKIHLSSTILDGFLNIPSDAKGIVIFAHGSGSNQLSPRNQLVAHFLNENNIATLLINILTPEEEEVDKISRALRFNIPFLAERVIAATEWIFDYQDTHHLTVGYFGASTGTAAALIAATELGLRIKAVVSRSGRPDLAGQALIRIQCPTLFIVGGNDYGVIEINQHSFDLLNCKKKFQIIPGASHLFEEPGTLEQVGRMASLWFSEHL